MSTEYDKIIDPEKFKSPELFNVHFSLLPKYKGMSTSILQILNGESETGVTLHKIRSGIDTGEIVDQQRIAIDWDMNSYDVYKKCLKAGVDIIKKNLKDLIDGNYKITPQNAEMSTYYSKDEIDYKHLRLNIKRTAHQIHNQIRAFAFRQYQLLTYNKIGLIGSTITNQVSVNRPGTIIVEDDVKMLMATIDYDIIIYKDVLDRLNKSIEANNNEYTKLLCEYKQIVNEKDSRGWTPLTVAVYNNNFEIFQFLLSLGADEKVVDNNGTTLLMYAKDVYMRTGDKTIFDCLMRIGLNIWQKDYKGMNLFDYCSKSTLKELNIINSYRGGGDCPKTRA